MSRSVQLGDFEAWKPRTRRRSLEFGPRGNIPLDVRRSPLSVSENRLGIWHSQFPRLARSPGDYLSTHYSQIWAAGGALVNFDAPVDADPDASSDQH